MSNDRTTAGKALRRWRESQDPKVTQAALGRDVGVSGSAIRHFENATEGFTLSLAVKVKLTQRTGLPLERIATRQEIQLARDLFAVMARDAAA